MPQIQPGDLHELEILEQVESSPELSTRAAAGRLGVSVKLAHATLKRMVSKGMLHIRKENARRWLYFVTPHGITEKGRLTVQFLEFSMRFYREARRQSAQVCRDLSESGVKEVAFLGGGDLAEICYLGLQEWGLTLTAVFDDSGATAFMGVPVQPLAEVAACSADSIIVCLYDPKEPLSKSYLPSDTTVNDRMSWIF